MLPSIDLVQECTDVVVLKLSVEKMLDYIGNMSQIIINYVECGTTSKFMLYICRSQAHT
jgi:hypothetical protein